MTSATAARLERLDPCLDTLVPHDAEIEVLFDADAVAGPHWLEGPVWDQHSQALLFSDTKGNVIYRWHAADGVSEVLRPSGYTGPQPAPMEEPGANGLAYDPEGRLVMCEHGDRRITRLEADGRKTVLAEAWQGCRLNSPNDIVCRSNGELWFTDPPYGLPGQLEATSKELPFHGVYRISRSGELALVLDSIDVPNGIAFSPDETTLYLTDGGPTQKRWLAFTVRHDGTLVDRRVFFDAAHLPGLGGPDGLVADAHGNLFATGLERVLVLSADGIHLGSIVPGGFPSNVAWGEEGSTLFITSSSRLLRMPTKTRGARF